MKDNKLLESLFMYKKVTTVAISKSKWCPEMWQKKYTGWKKLQTGKKHKFRPSAQDRSAIFVNKQTSDKRSLEQNRECTWKEKKRKKYFHNYDRTFLCHFSMICFNIIHVIRGKFKKRRYINKFVNCICKIFLLY